MIFLNRRRTIISTDAPIIKDPSKYWYVEKYIYGELKETVEIPLGTGTKFTGIESGYEDDWFEGWSKSSTSTTRTFNITTSYKNTTTSVKNLLDSDNTIKLYGVYRYNTRTTKNSSSMSGNTTWKYIAQEDSTLTLSGKYTVTTYTYVNGSLTNTSTTSSDVTFYIYDVNGSQKQKISTGKSTSKKVVDVVAGDKIAIKTIFQDNRPYNTTNPPSGNYDVTESTASINSTGYMYNLMTSPKYRVISHT